MNIKQFAIDCYDYSNKRLFQKCLELYEELSEVQSKLYESEKTRLEELEELEELRHSVTIEVSSDDVGKITECDYDYNYVLTNIQKHMPDVVGFLVKELPSELGLYNFEIITFNQKIAEHRILKIWLVPRDW